MGGRKRRNTVDINPELEHGEYGDANYCLKFRLWKYLKGLTVIGTDI